MSSPSTGSSVPAARKIVLAKIEALADGHAGDVASVEQHMEGHVLGYLEVQQEGSEGGTIYFQPDEIEIDGEHLLLTQGEEGGEIIVVVSTEQRDVSKCDAEIVYSQDDQTVVEVPAISDSGDFHCEAELVQICQKGSDGQDTENNLLDATLVKDCTSVVEVVNGLENNSELQVVEDDGTVEKTYFQVVTDQDGRCTIDENGIVCEVVDSAEKVLDVCEESIAYAPDDDNSAVYNIVADESVVDAQVVAEVVVDTGDDLQSAYSVNEETVEAGLTNDVLLDLTQGEPEDEASTKTDKIDDECDSGANFVNEVAFDNSNVDVSLSATLEETCNADEVINSQTELVAENKTVGCTSETQVTNSAVHERRNPSEEVAVEFDESSVNVSSVALENISHANEAINSQIGITDESELEDSELIESRDSCNEVAIEIDSNARVLEENGAVSTSIHKQVHVFDDSYNCVTDANNESESLIGLLRNDLKEVTSHSNAESDVCMDYESVNIVEDSSQTVNEIVVENSENITTDALENECNVEDDMESKEEVLTEENSLAGHGFAQNKITYQMRPRMDTLEESAIVSNITEGIEMNDLTKEKVHDLEAWKSSGKRDDTQEVNECLDNLTTKDMDVTKSTIKSLDSDINDGDHNDKSADMLDSTFSPEQNCDFSVNAKDSVSTENVKNIGDNQVPSNTNPDTSGVADENLHAGSLSSETRNDSNLIKTDNGASSAKNMDEANTESKTLETGTQRRKSARQLARREAKMDSRNDGSTQGSQTSEKNTVSISDSSEKVLEEENVKDNVNSTVLKANSKVLSSGGAEVSESTYDFDVNMEDDDILKSKTNGLHPNSPPKIGSSSKKIVERNRKRKLSTDGSPLKRNRQSPNKKVSFGKSDSRSQEERFDDLLRNQNKITPTHTRTKKSYIPLMSSFAFSVTSPKKRKGVSLEEVTSKKVKVADRSRKKDIKGSSSKSTPTKMPEGSDQNRLIESSGNQEKTSCKFYIRYQSPTKTPEKDKSPYLYNCTECHFKTTRIENIIHHLKECSMALQWDMQGQGMGEKAPTRFTLEKESAVMTTPVKSSPKKIVPKKETPVKKRKSSKKVAPKVSTPGEGDDAVSDTKESVDNLSDEFESDSDSDDDLPLMLGTPSKSDLPYKEDDIVWVEWKNQHWPALARKIYAKTKKVSILFIDTPMPEKGMRVGMRKVSTFDDATRNKQYMSEGRTKPSGDQQIKAVQKAEDYLRKLCLGLKMSAFDYFNKPEGYISDLDNSSEMDVETSHSLLDHPLLSTSVQESQLADPSQQTEINNDNGHNNSVEEMDDEKLSPISAAREEKLQKMKELRKEQNVKFLNCIKDGKVEAHLLGVYQGTIGNERHRKFHSEVASERNQLKHVTWFGPIDDEEQQEEIIDYCLNLFKTNFVKKESFDLMAYVFEVWTPEAIIKSISRMLLISLPEAEEIFEKGINWSHENQEIVKQANTELAEPLPP